MTDTLTRPHQADAATASPHRGGLPLKIGIAVYAAALPLWGLQAAAGHVPALIALALAGAIAALVVRSRTDAGRRPALAAVATATAWAGLFAVFGWSWLLTALWATAVGLFWPAWQRTSRTTAPSEPEEDNTAAARKVLQDWTDYVAADGPLKDMLLEVTKTNGLVHHFAVHFVRGKHTFAQLAAQRAQIASALDIPEDNLTIEKGRTAAGAKMTVITGAEERPPAMYPGPSFDPETGIVTFGLYDADRTPAPLSVIDDNGAFGILFSGDVGTGKSACMEQVGLSLLASGYFVGLYVDPQGGMSSPALAEASKWTARSVEEAAALVRALPRWRRLRQITFRMMGRNGYKLSKKHPVLILFMDEVHEIVNGLSPEDQKIFVEMVKTLRKVGAIFLVGTQNVGLPAFGGNSDLRSQLMSRNVVYFYSSSKQQKSLSGNNEFDPSKLPSGTPGFGFVKELRVKGKLITRAAPIRAYYLGHESDFNGMNPGLAWLEHLRQHYEFAELPIEEAGAFGAAFARREADRAEADAGDAAFLAACLAAGAGELDPERLDDFEQKPKDTTQEPARSGLLSMRLGGPEEEPASPVEEFPDAKKTQAILNALRAGAWRTAEIRTHAAQYQVEVSTSLVEQRLKQFLADGTIIRVGTGHYHAVGAEINCGHPRCRG